LKKTDNSDFLKRIITISSNKNDLVFDPFMNNGDFVIESAKLSRNYIGCDKNKDKFNLIIKRLEELEDGNNNATKEKHNKCGDSVNCQ
jgi:DNA modification methylase